MKDFLIYVIMVFVIIGLFYIYRLEKQKTQRLYNNIESLVTENKHYKDSMMISNRVLSLELKEIKDLYPEIKKELKEVNIKLNDVRQYQTMQLDINAKFMADLKRFNDTSKQLIGEYTDNFIHYISHINLNDSSEFVQLKMPAKLDQVIYEKKACRFWQAFFIKR